MSKKKQQHYLRCKLCNNTFTASGLAKHVQYIHGFKSGKEYFDTIIEPYIHICIHCHKNPTKYINIALGYKDSCGQHDCEIAQSRKTKLERYGDPNYSNREKFKNTINNKSNEEKQLIKNKQKVTHEKHKKENPDFQKIINEKNLKTRIEKYGKYQSNETIEKRKQTCIQKYGVDNLYKSEEIKKKIRISNLKNNGVEYPTQSKEIKNKGIITFKKHCNEDPLFKQSIIYKNQQTRLQRYGNKNYRNIEQQKQTVQNKSKEEKQKIIEKRQNTCMKKYGVNNYTEICNRAASISSLSYRIKTILDVNNISYEMEYRIYTNEYTDKNNKKFRAYDFKFGKILLELNGDYFHANPKFYKCTDIISIRMVQHTAQEIWIGDEQKKILAENNGFSVKYLWENDIKKMTDDEILSWVKINCLQ